jgi:hypothetical protein
MKDYTAMLVRIIEHIVGAGFSYWPGDDIEMPDDEARRFVAAGYAEPIAPANRGECAMLAPATPPPRPQPRRRPR